MKKCLFFGLALLIALSGVLVGCSCEKKEGGSTAGTIQVPGGPKIKVVCVDFPEELKMEWEKLATDEIQIILKGALRNVSSQKVSIDRIVFLLDGKEIGHWPAFGGPTLLGPDEEMKFYEGIVVDPDTLNASKLIEVKIVGFKKAEAQEPPKQEPSETNKTIFTKAPSNPQTPAEVVAAFYFLWNEKKYSEAKKFATSSWLQEAEKHGGLEQGYKELFQRQTLVKIEIAEIDIIDKEAVEIDAITLYYSDGSKEFFMPANLVVIKENGKWKINE